MIVRIALGSYPTGHSLQISFSSLRTFAFAFGFLLLTHALDFCFAITIKRNAYVLSGNVFPFAFVLCFLPFAYAFVLL